MSYTTLTFNNEHIKFYNWIPNEYILNRRRGRYHETETLKTILDFNLKGNYIDVGSYIGTYSIAFSKFSKATNIIAFEPQKKIYQVLLRNLDINNIHNVVPYNTALGNKSGKGITYLDDRRKFLNNYGATIIKPALTGDISIQTLDSYDLEDVILLKIDAEGSEVDILKGAKDTLRNNNIECIITECNTEGCEDKLTRTIPNYEIVQRTNENIIWRLK